MESINHYTVQRVIDVAANVDGRDLGCDRGRHPEGDRRGQQRPAVTTKIFIRGQNEVMETLVPQPRRSA